MAFLFCLCTYSLRCLVLWYLWYWLRLFLQRFWWWIKMEYHSVRPPAQNPYYMTSSRTKTNQISQIGHGSTIAGSPFIEILHQSQSALAVPVIPVGTGRSLHYHTHTPPHQQPLTYPNWVPFTHFGWFFYNARLYFMIEA